MILRRKRAEPLVDRIQRLELDSGDVLVLSVGGHHISRDVASRIREQVETACPGHRALVLHGDMELGSITPARSDAVTYTALNRRDWQCDEPTTVGNDDGAQWVQRCGRCKGCAAAGCTEAAFRAPLRGRAADDLLLARVAGALNGSIGGSVGRGCQAPGTSPRY